MFGLLLLITSTGRSSAEHWSFVPIRRPPLPTVQRGDWALNAIDRFVLAQLEKAGRAPAQAASPAELLRRVTLDLTGLPPTPVELDAFLADQAPDAYERVLDRLLQSPRYGEHRARFWLDAARYGDTHGLHFDNERAIWPYRDWVVAAFNRNQPFDEFTMEQVAGDLLPNATIAQRVATGFHRCNVATGEEGAIPKEYRMRYAIDRVETTGTVWMGLTLGCAACHDHPYDPVSQTEFYRLVAIFNQVAEPAIHGNALLPPPTVKTPSAAQSLAHQRLRQTVQPAAATTGQVAARNTKVTDDSLLSYQQQQRLRRLESAFSGTMVMRDLSRPRPTYELIRGQYDQPAQPVAPDVPDFLPSLPETSRPNRLALARWLVRDDHPLTARVAVNHFWQQYFGIGIVETSEDFGIEGALPSHPQLLDWLAAEFIESGWNVKALQRLIVSSATYRQSAVDTEQAYRQDPRNRSLARTALSHGRRNDSRSGSLCRGPVGGTTGWSRGEALPARRRVGGGRAPAEQHGAL